MTLEFLSQIIIIVAVLIALDLALLHLRKSVDGKKLPFMDSISQAFNRFRDWFSRLHITLPKRNFSIQRPAALVAAQKTENAPETDSALAAPVTEAIISQEIASDSEWQATGGMARVHIDAEVPAGTVIHITISTDQEGHASVHQTRTVIGAAKARPRARWSAPTIPARSWLEAVSQSWHRLWTALLALPAERLAFWLFGAAILIYLVTRLAGLTNFPIYFFGDEAVQTVSASDLVRRGFRGPGGSFLPTYFQNGTYYNLSLSVYLQVLPLLVFGKSILVTRATSVLVTLLAVLSVGLILRNSLGAKRWWAGTLILAAVPAWFLHSRTAFETVLFVSFYAAFLYFYLEYRLRDPKKVYYAVLMAGLAFYSYSPGQLVLAATALFLLINDFKYHWEQRRVLFWGIALVVLIALPYIRFRLTGEYSPLDHLRQLGSYWAQPLPLSEKLTKFLGQYFYGLSPAYWFATGPTDLMRHQMSGYGNLAWWMLPFIIIGLMVSFWHWRSPAHRIVLLAFLAAPAGASLAEIGITRVLVFVIPASLLAALGLDFVLKWLESAARSRSRIPEQSVQLINSLIVFALLLAANVAMLADALINGPTWYKDYGLYGMQYGAKQVYQGLVVPALKQDPQAKFVVSPSWANGAEQFVGFFVPPEDQPRVTLGQIYDLLNQRPLLTSNDYFVVTPEEYNAITSDKKFRDIVIRSTINYPDGRIGFYVINLNYVENIDEMMVAETEARRKPIEETFELNGQPIRAFHSPFSGGTLTDLMDDNPETLAKGLEANPIEFEYFYPEPISTNKLELRTGSMANFVVTVKIYPPGSDQPVEYTQTFTNSPDDPLVTIEFPNGPAQSDHIYISVKDNNQGEHAQVHVREITFK